MPVLLWVALVLLALLAALSRLRVGLRATLSSDGPTAEARIGPLRFPLYPGKEEAPPEPSQTAGSPKRDRRKPGAGRAVPLSRSDLREGWQTLWPPVRRALARTRRGVRVQPLRLSVTLGGAPDPAGAAETYGLLCALLWTVMPALEEVVDIRDPAIHLGVNYEVAETAAEGELGVSLRLGTLLAVALGAGLPVLRWLSARRGRKTAPPKQAPARNI